jgi:hypothetical protein
MVKPVSAEFQDFVLELETATPGTFAKICGITSRGISRQTSLQSSSTPQDCEDESLPLEVKKSVESSEVSMTATGTWASQSHEMMLDWWYSGAKKNVRLYHANAAVGDTEYETGGAYLTSLGNEVEKGQAVTASIEIQFDGVPTRTAKAEEP